MKNIKKTVATLGLLGIIIMTASSAQAGIVMAGRTASGSTTITKRVVDSIRNIVIGQLTGVTIQNKEGIMFSDKANNREGIMFSDQATARTPVYITD